MLPDDEIPSVNARRRQDVDVEVIRRGYFFFAQKLHRKFVAVGEIHPAFLNSQIIVAAFLGAFQGEPTAKLDSLVQDCRSLRHRPGASRMDLDPPRPPKIPETFFGFGIDDSVLITPARSGQ
jgi:hypothetical protein